MYQIEVKRWLVTHHFPPTDGWTVTVDLDAMERARGGSHPNGKMAVAEQCELWLRNAGVTIGCHVRFGRADVVAEHPKRPMHIIEVEGDSSRQSEQALYSALGQAILNMADPPGQVRYGVAVPDTVAWERQLRKVPLHVREALNLDCLLVSESGVRSLQEGR
jgi:hypothetical protein